MSPWPSTSQLHVQEQNEALLAQLHARERTIRELMLQHGSAADQVAAFMANIDARCAPLPWPDYGRLPARHCCSIVVQAAPFQCVFQ